MPSQHSTGGKPRLGHTTKRGDDYLRTLLIQGAKSAVVALANKNARIVWALLTRGEVFDPQHVPIAPSERVALDAAAR